MIPCVTGEVSIIAQAEGAQGVSDVFQGCIKPHVVISNLLSDSKVSEQKRLQSLGFDVLSITEKGEVTYDEGDLIKARRGGGANDAWVFGVVVRVHFSLDESLHSLDEDVHLAKIRTGYYDIDYEDNSTEAHVYWKVLLPVSDSEKKSAPSLFSSPITIGENVQVWSGQRFTTKDADGVERFFFSAGVGPWKEAVVEDISFDNNCSVQYTDGSAERNVPISWLRPYVPTAENFEIGDHITAMKRNRTVWDEGEIVAFEDGRYTVGYKSAELQGDMSDTVLTVKILDNGIIKVGQLVTTFTFAPDYSFVITGDLGENKFLIQPFGDRIELEKRKPVTLSSASLKTYELEADIPSSRIRSKRLKPAVSVQMCTTNMTAIVAPNILLVTKIVVADEICQKIKKDPNRYSLRHRTRIVQAALNRLEQCGFPKEDMWLSHDDDKPSVDAIYSNENDWFPRKQKERQNKEDNHFGSKKCHPINDYYGSKIALYFAWCTFYLKWLVVPAFFGVYLFFQNWYYGEISHTGTFFSIFLSIWSTCFIEFWKRRNSELAISWDVYDHDDIDMKRTIAKSISEKGSNKIMRFAITIPCLISVLFVMCYIMVYFIHLQDHAEEIYGKYSLMKYYPFVVYSVIPSVFQIVFGYIADKLTEFEEHKNEVDAENHKIYKHFALTFVNSYCMLFYVSFWLKDIARLRKTLLSLLVMGQVTGNIIEYLPSLHLSLNSAFASLKTYFLFHKKANESHKNAHEAAEMTNDSTKSVYDVGADYMELVIQFGYVAMFSTVLPLIPFFACLNNMFEAQLDFAKLSDCRRPLIEERSSLGAWLHCMEVVSVFGVITNCYFLGEVSQDFASLFPANESEFMKTDFGKFVAVIALEHILLGIKVFLLFGIEDEPQHVKEVISCKLVSDEKRKSIHRVQRLFDILRSGTAGLEQLKQENDSFEDAKLLAEAKAIKNYPQRFALNPLMFGFLLTFPLVFQYFGISMWFYVPVAAVYLTYVQVEKNRSDYQSALGIVTDADIIKYVVKEMPSWIEDSESQRAEWINMILTKLWPHVSEATDQKMKKILTPTFDKIVKSRGLENVASLKLDKFVLGEISPKIKSIRVHSTHESTVRMDWELAWAGNPEIVILLGLGDKLGIPELPIEVCDFRMSMNLRIELKNLLNSFPCFSSVRLTCMKQPFVDLSCKLGVINLANVGLGNLNVRELIMQVISQSLNEQLLFPNFYETAMTDNTTLDKVVAPVGLLQLTVIKGVNLQVCDMFTSDPYVVISVNDNEIGKTQVVYETLNPVWNESFDVLVFDKSTQKIQLKIFDWDLVGVHDNMGYCIIETEYIEMGQTKERTLHIRGDNQGVRGTIIVSYNYVELARSDVRRGHIAEDEAFLLDLPDIANTSLDLIENGVISDILAANKIGTDSIPDLLPSLNLSGSGFQSPRASTKSGTSNSKERKRGVLSISEIRCKHLKALPSLVEFLVPTSLKCLVRFQVGSQKKETKVICNHQDPVFKESFCFVVEDPINATVLVNVIDKADIFNDRIMGYIEIPVPEYLEHAVEKDYILQGKSEECSIHYKATWYTISTEKRKHKI